MRDTMRHGPPRTTTPRAQQSASVCALASAFALLGPACGPAAPQVVDTGPTTAFSMQLAGGREVLTTRCTETELQLRLSREARCLRWEYEHATVELPGNPADLAWTVARIAAGPEALDDPPWPNPYEPPRVPETEHTVRAAVDEFPCLVPIAEAELVVPAGTVTTTQDGAAAIPRPDGPLSVRHGERSWVVGCDPE